MDRPDFDKYSEAELVKWLIEHHADEFCDHVAGDYSKLGAVLEELDKRWNEGLEKADFMIENAERYYYQRRA